MDSLESIHNQIKILKTQIASQETRIQYLSGAIANIQHSEELDLREGETHDQISCDGCSQVPLKGIRYKCKTCEDYDLCSECRNRVPHGHPDFYRIVASKFPQDKQCSSCEVSVCLLYTSDAADE